MRKVLLLVVTLVSLCSYAQKGEKSVNLQLGYGTEIKNVGLGAKFAYNVTAAIRLAPSFDYFFKKDFVSNWNINVDAHYLFPIADKFKVYPLVGLTYSSWKVDLGGAIEDAIEDMGGYIEDDGEDDGGSLNVTEGRFGMNIGAGIQYDINQTWGLNFEFKYQIIKDFNQAVFNVGVVYKF